MCSNTVGNHLRKEEVRMPGRGKTHGFAKNKITSTDLIFYSVMESHRGLLSPELCAELSALWQLRSPVERVHLPKTEGLRTEPQ